MNLMLCVTLQWSWSGYSKGSQPVRSPALKSSLVGIRYNVQCWVRYSLEVFQIQILIHYHKCILDTVTKYYIENVSRYRYNYKSI